MGAERALVQLPQGPATWPPPRAWPQVVHEGVARLKDVIERWNIPAETPGSPLLIAVSGGADSLALAILAAEAQRVTGVRCGAIILDHQLQDVTAEVAHRTADICARLGLVPVITQNISVTETGEGLEAAARHARYDAFVQCAHQEQAVGVCTAHTANDQAEQVLLGLARGSGLRSIAGIRQDRLHQVPGYSPVRIARPLLALTRDDTESICSWAGVQFFQDPMNEDDSIARIRVRKHLLPLLADPKQV